MVGVLECLAFAFVAVPVRASAVDASGRAVPPQRLGLAQGWLGQEGGGDEDFDVHSGGLVGGVLVGKCRESEYCRTGLRMDWDEEGRKTIFRSCGF